MGEIKTVYIGNLAYRTTKESLIKFLHPHVPVRLTIVIDKDTNLSRGFGFAEFSAPETALAVVNTLDGEALDGRILKINLAQPRERDDHKKGRQE